MTLTWDNQQDYSNQALNSGGYNDAGSPGFWFGPPIIPSAPDPDGQVSYRPTTLNANTQISQSQPVYNLSIPSGTNVSQAGDTITILMQIPDTYTTVEVSASYVGEFSYKYVPHPTPATIGEFQLTKVTGIDTQDGILTPPDYAALAALTKAVDTGRYAVYLQLLPHTGSASVDQGNPATPGSPVTLSTATWNFDTNPPAIEIACFLPGSMIATATGPRAVETLAVGDLVLTGPAGSQTLEPVTWVGRGHVEVQTDLPDDRAGYAVCISKGALGDNCPDADLYLTSEHTLYLDGHFVPVRMLVNHRSIFYDRQRLSYDYYHFETAEHSIVQANGTVTESYLSSGSSRRHFRDMQFLQQGNVVAFPPSKSWEKDACAPLAVDVSFVQPLHEMLDSRARALGFARQVPPVALTSDSDFHLVTDTGDVLYPIRRVRDQTIFLLPEGVRSLYLRSRTSRPCDTVGVYVDDRRSLGVLVGTMELYQGSQTHHLTRHLTDRQASGWDVVENSPCRWTNGNAFLSLEDVPAIHERDMLAIQLVAEGPYLDRAQTATSTIALPRKTATP